MQTKVVIIPNQQTAFSLAPANPLPKLSQRPVCHANEQWVGWKCATIEETEDCAIVALHGYPNDNPEVLEWQEFCRKNGYDGPWNKED